MKSSIHSSSTKICDGVVYFNDNKCFLNSTDYPYYRDDPGLWSDRLEKLKSLGHAVISCYIPWRHHEIEVDGVRSYDFHGETYPNRDVIGFLKLCQEKDIRVIAKPGPFIHAEVNYGGLPNWVCPTFNPAIEPMLGANGKPFTWGGIQRKQDGTGLEELPLPAPLDPQFQSQMEHWLRVVTKEVIAPFSDPDGPIVMVQVANEGIYSNYQRAPWAYDYSRSSLKMYTKFLQKIYGSLNHYNKLHGTKWDKWGEIGAPRIWICPSGLLGILYYSDWAAYQAYYMREILTRLRGWIPVNLPFLINVNPPTNEHFGIDAWLSRINPDDLPGLHYGFTNWIGIASKDPTVVERYQLMIKRARGANQEENWGFSKLYEREHVFPSVCFYQTLIQIACGATGYNIYTGIGTRHVNPDLDQLHQDMYPDCPPIDGDGQFTPKADTVRNLNKFFNRWGIEFLETQPIHPIAFGIYLPYAHSAVWVSEQDWEKVKALGVPDHGQVLLQFQRLCLRIHLDFGLANLQVIENGQLQGHPTLVLASGRWMDRQTQEKLQRYVQGGGQLILVGEIPQLDENFQPLNSLKKLKDKIQSVPWEDFKKWSDTEWRNHIATLPGITAINVEASQARIWQYSHPIANIDYLFVFSGESVKGPIKFRFHSHGEIHTLGLNLPAYSAGVIRIQDGKISNALVKGKNEELGTMVVPACRLDGEIISADQLGDWF